MSLKQSLNQFYWNFQQQKKNPQKHNFIFLIKIVKLAVKGTCIYMQQATVSKGKSHFFHLMNNAYNFNLYIKDIFSGSLQWPLYTGLTTVRLVTIFTSCN